MRSASLRPPRPSRWQPALEWVAGAFLLVLALLLAPAGAHAAPPPAGTSISNQASATYSDGSGVARTVTSNLVQTTVTQVHSLTLTAPGAQAATPGSVVYYPHTVTNTGNGSDTFNLATSQTSTPSLTSIEIYADNGSGAPTGSPITSSGVLASGASFKFIVRATVPTSATSGDTNTITVTATSAGDNTKSASNADVTTVTGNAVIQLGKAIGISSGAPGTTGIQYTLTYTNNGNSTASTVAITDVLPAGMALETGSVRWSVTGATALTAGVQAGSSPNTLTFTYNAASRTFVANISQVTPGQSGQVRFTVAVGSSVAPGVLTNTASVQYSNGATPTPATVTSTSNGVDFTVTQTANVTFAGATNAGPAAPGSTISFTNVLTNTGNGTDTFNVTLGTSTFPAGTTFQLYKSDGTTPLVDTNGDGIIDTGPLAAAAAYNVILRATLPPNASAPGAVTVQKIARSVFDSTRTATATDTLSAITSASVDLTNNLAAASGVPGFGPGPGGSAQVTNATNPGTTTVFTLVANNTGPAPDSYNLAAGSTAAMAALPTGWTVEFRAASGGSCTTMGATVTNTGSIAAAGNATFCAVVTVPAGYDAGVQPVYFRIASPTSSVSDVLWDAVNVNAVRSISLTPNGTGQTYPGGSYVYTHSLTNNGNVAEGGTVSTLTPVVPNSGGWSSTLYVDSNSNGTLDAGDALVTGALAGTLAKGASVTVFHRVIAPSGAVPGTVHAATITVTTTNGSYTTTVPVPAVATDSTTVIAGNLTLTKVQALDAACDGTADGAYSQANLNARPGQCVLYKVTVTNVGAADATNVIVSDATPTFTRISTAPAITTTGGFTTGELVSPPAVGAAGTSKAHIGADATTAAGGTLPAGQSAEITFGVRIDN